jgi:hypothetical protein
MMHRSVSTLLWWVLGSPLALAACTADLAPPGAADDPEEALEPRAHPNYGTCNPRCKTGETCCNGVCTKMNDIFHCGSCQRKCSGPIANCVMGNTCTCELEGYVACPTGDPASGSKVCTDLKDDKNCGACGKLCLGGTCGDNGTCTCPPNTTACPQGGGIACVDTDSAKNHCGGCGQRCDGSCGGGECFCFEHESRCTIPDPNVQVVAAMMSDPDAPLESELHAALEAELLAGPGPTFTYCADLQKDPDNCGACGFKCQSRACANGQCVVCPDTLCPSPDGGKCTDTATDYENCGFCGVVCPSNMVCAQSQCVCDAMNPDYCPQQNDCRNLQKDVNNCGRCGSVCMPGVGCTDGACDCPNPGNTPQNCQCTECDTNEICAPANGKLCQACEPYETRCGNLCREIKTDRFNCGACGNACADDQICENSACKACPAGRTRCDNACRDLQTDRFHCGACNHLCAFDKVCQNGQCVADGGSSGGESSGGWSGTTGGDAPGTTGTWTGDWSGTTGNPSGPDLGAGGGGTTFDPDTGSGG